MKKTWQSSLLMRYVATYKASSLLPQLDKSGHTPGPNMKPTLHSTKPFKNQNKSRYGTCHVMYYSFYKRVQTNDTFLVKRGIFRSLFNFVPRAYPFFLARESVCLDPNIPNGRPLISFFILVAIQSLYSQCFQEELAFLLFSWYTSGSLPRIQFIIISLR